MSAIPINPAAISGAAAYTASGNAFPINTLNQPPANEGPKGLSMQFTFNQKTAWLVNFPNNPNPPMSQIASLYIDATQSQFDVTILFPDSGYSVRINALGARMIPVITTRRTGSLPSFYVLLDSSDQLSDSVVNIIALNQFIPEFEANELTPFLSYGFGQLFVPQPAFTQSTVFYTQANITTPAPVILINAKQWYITALFVSAAINISANNTPNLQLKDNGQIILAKTLPLNTGLFAVDIFDNTGMQLLSGGSGPLTANLDDLTGISGSLFNFSVMGGILIP